MHNLFHGLARVATKKRRYAAAARREARPPFSALANGSAPGTSAFCLVPLFLIPILQ